MLDLNILFQSEKTSKLFILHELRNSNTVLSFNKIGCCHLGFHGAFEVTINASKSCGIIGQPKDELYQVDHNGDEIITQSQDIEIEVQLLIEISNVKIFQSLDLISNSLKE